MNQTTSFVAEPRWRGKAFLGRWSTTDGGVVDVSNPATGEVLAQVGAAAPADVVRAAHAARQSQPSWAAKRPSERAAILVRAAHLLEQNRDEIIGWIVRESGSVRAKAAMELDHAAAFVRHAAGVAVEPRDIVLPSMEVDRSSIARRVPHGVVGVISPFNFPLVLSIRAIAAALGVGNAVVHKPDLRTAVSGGVVIARVFEDAGLPEGVLQVLPGNATAGEAMCIDPNVAMISFTGSSKGGCRVGELAGRHLKKVQLELGGKNSLIVMDDMDLEIAASNVAWGVFLHQGQICMSTGLVLAQSSIAEELATKVAVKARAMRVGDPSSDGVALGPLISDAQAMNIQAIVDDSVSKGAHKLTGGTYSGRYYQATVLADVKPGMRAFEEEIFGPVACFVSFGSDDEAIALANSSEYGLAAGVLSGSITRARAIGDRLAVGHLHINDQTVNGSPFAPFGGRGRSGNGSRIGGPAIWDEFTQWQWISERAKATPYPV